MQDAVTALAVAVHSLQEPEVDLTIAVIGVSNRIDWSEEEFVW